MAIGQIAAYLVKKTATNYSVVTFLASAGLRKKMLRPLFYLQDFVFHFFAAIFNGIFPLASILFVLVVIKQNSVFLHIESAGDSFLLKRFLSGTVKNE